MADARISALTQATTLTGAELVPLVQGGTTKQASARLLVGAGNTVATIAAMTALTGMADGQVAQPLGYYAAGDGGGGPPRYWSAASTATHNGGSVLQPDSAPAAGRWLWDWSGAINAKWFGAKGDGTTDDTTKIQAAATAAINSPAKELLFSDGSFKIVPATNVAYNDNSSLTRKTGVVVESATGITVRGEGAVDFVVGGTDAERVLFFFKNSTNVRITGLGFNLTASSTSEGGSDYLTGENFIPLAFEGVTGLTVEGNAFAGYRTAVFADAKNGTANKRINVTNNRFTDGVNYALLTRNADTVGFTNNITTGTGRNWSTDTEDVALSDTTTNAVASGNRFVSMRGSQSRITAVRNDGPTSITGNVKTGKGIDVEIFEASNITVSGNAFVTDSGTSEHILFAADGVNTRGENVVVTGNYFKGGGYVISDYNPGSHTKDGLIFSNNVCDNTYGPECSSQRSGVIVSGNRFDLSSSGQSIWFTGQGTTFSHNVINNGYLKIDGTSADSNRQKVIGNTFRGNFGTPIAYALVPIAAVGLVVQGNFIVPGSYSNYINKTPATRFGFRYLDFGHDSNPEFGLASYITGELGDIVRNEGATAGTPVEWRCTVAGSPGTWVVVPQVGQRTGTAAPAINANFVGEEWLDTTAGRWYKAINTGTGATDWVALN